MNESHIKQMIVETNAYADRAIKLVEDNQKKQELYDDYGRDLVDELIENFPNLALDEVRECLQSFS